MTCGRIKKSHAWKFPCSFWYHPTPRSGLTSVPVHVGGGLGLQMPSCIFYCLEVGRDFHQRDTDAAELAYIHKSLDRFHQLLCAFLTVFHDGLAACTIFFCEPVIKETVDCQHIGCFNRADVTFSHAVAHHHTDGICFIRGTVAQELQNGLCLCADNGSAFFFLDSLFVESKAAVSLIPGSMFLKLSITVVL